MTPTPPSDTPNQPAATSESARGERPLGISPEGVELIRAISQSNEGLVAVLRAQAEKVKAEERWGRVKVFMFMIPLLLFAFLYSVSISSAVTKATTDHIAIVRIDGNIAPGNKASAQKLTAPLRSAFNSKYSKAVVLAINSPGGSPSQAIAIYDEVIALKKANPGKKVYAVAEDVVASAAYLIALSADEIWVQPTTITGSIGVIWESFGFDPGVLSKYGVEHRLLVSDEHKARYSPFLPMKPEDRTRLQGIINKTDGIFTDYVKASRGEKLSKDVDLFTGDWWIGRDAVALGLADAEGGVDAMARANYPMVPERKEYSASDWMSVLSGINGKALFGLDLPWTGGFR